MGAIRNSVQAFSAGGMFLPGGSVIFGNENQRPDPDNPGTLKQVFTDVDLTTPAQNPQPLDSDAKFEQGGSTGTLYGSGVYSYVVLDASSVERTYVPSFTVISALTAQEAAEAAEAAQAAAEAAQQAAEDAAESITVPAGTSITIAIDTIADLRALEPLFDGQQIELLGHTTAGIGGGIFYADFSDTTSPDNNGTVIVTPGGRRWKRKRKDFVLVDDFGVMPNDISANNNAAFINAVDYAVSISQQDGDASLDVTARVDVAFTGGSFYAFRNATIALDVQAVRVNFIAVGGAANIMGYDPSSPLVKNPLGFTFNRVYRTTFERLNFVGFDGVHQWDTNNVDSAIVRYVDCEFVDCSTSTVPAVNTVSFAQSRSTRLEFDDCRTSGTSWLVDSYCDQLAFIGGYHRNADSSNRYVRADSQVTVDGGIWTPYQVGNDARWFDLYDNLSAGSRGIVVQGGARFGAESGGIPVVYNYMEGEDVAINHRTNYIMFYGSSSTATPGVLLHRGIVVLQDDGVNSYAPSLIGFYGASVRSNEGLVKTQNGLAPNRSRGRFVIDVSAASQSFLSDYNTALSVPLVEDVLRPYLVGLELYNEPTVIAAANPMTIDLAAINAGPDAIIQINGTGAVVAGITGAYDGQQITIEFLSSSATVQDFSSGSRIFLSGSADYTTNGFGTITLRWHRAGNKWFEIGRCSR